MWSENPSVSGGSSKLGIELKFQKMLCRFYGWYWFLLQKNTLSSIHISLYDFCVVFVVFLFNLVGISSSVKARKKNYPRFFHRIFVSNQNFSKSVSYVDLPNRVDEHEARSAPQPPPLASFFPRRSDPGKLVEVFVERGSSKCWFFLRWKNGHFGENRGVCAQKEQLLP